MQAIIMLGSNSGNKRRLLETAVQMLSATESLVKVSSLYETEPWGFECDEYFLNQAAVFQTRLTAPQFLQRCLEIETQLGRARTEGGPRYTSRPIDIDLLFYDSLILETADLILPHPRLQARNFVLTPLAEILPDFVHPVLRQTISELQALCPDPLRVRKVE